MTAWSPGRHSVRKRVSSAASPDANASPRRPPSTAARHSSSAVRVGLADRLYSYPPRSPPTPSCLYVEVWWIGTTTDPVAGSASCPAWIASVSNPYSLIRWRLLGVEPLDHVGVDRQDA